MTWLGMLYDKIFRRPLFAFGTIGWAISRKSRHVFSEPQLDPRAILAALGIAGAGGIAPARGGTDTLIWRVEHRSGPLALRVFRASQAAHWRQELDALAAAAAAGIPVPAVRAAGLWRDRPATLLAWSAGEPLLQILLRRPWLASSLGRAFGRMQARLHRVAAPAGWPPDAWLGWGAPHDPAVRAALERMTSARSMLLHLDYHPLNVLADRSQITAVLDWVNARAGDPRADVARTATILRLAPAGRPPTLLLRLQRRALEHTWRRGYEQEHGPLGDLTAFYAWAGAVMRYDLAPRAARPGTGVLAGELARIDAWTRDQVRRLNNSYLGG
jgi:aminoglycoside phosphotransferase (APT) family kinase protein